MRRAGQPLQVADHQAAGLPLAIRSSAYFSPGRSRVFPFWWSWTISNRLQSDLSHVASIAAADASSRLRPFVGGGRDVADHRLTRPDRSTARDRRLPRSPTPRPRRRARAPCPLAGGAPRHETPQPGQGKRRKPANTAHARTVATASRERCSPAAVVAMVCGRAGSAATMDEASPPGVARTSAASPDHARGSPSTCAWSAVSPNARSARALAVLRRRDAAGATPYACASPRRRRRPVRAAPAGGERQPRSADRSDHRLPHRRGRSHDAAAPAAPGGLAALGFAAIPAP